MANSELADIKNGPVSPMRDGRIQVDVVCSLGFNCRPSLLLRRMGWRTFSGPVDWLSIPSAQSTVHLFDTGFTTLLDEFESIPTNHKQVKDAKVVDTKNGVTFIHPYMKGGVQVRIRDLSIEEIKWFHRSRWERQRRVMSLAPCSLFVRFAPEKTAGDMDHVLLKGMVDRFAGNRSILVYIQKRRMEGRLSLYWASECEDVLRFDVNEGVDNDELFGVLCEEIVRQRFTLSDWHPKNKDSLGDDEEDLLKGGSDG